MDIAVVHEFIDIIKELNIRCKFSEKFHWYKTKYFSYEDIDFNNKISQLKNILIQNGFDVTCDYDMVKIDWSSNEGLAKNFFSGSKLSIGVLNFDTGTVIVSC